MKSRIVMIVGTRPNMIKAAAIASALERYEINYEVIHTGQHYDENMGVDVFEGLVKRKHGRLHHLKLSNSTMDSMMWPIRGAIMEIAKSGEFNPVVIVFGDVDSSLAAALACKKYQPSYDLVHVEAGLRSFDRGMPEEINRTMIDCVSDVLFLSEDAARRNVERYALASHQTVSFAGNTMIDTLDHVMRTNDIHELCIRNKVKLGLSRDGEYVLVTLHRPSNVDGKDRLKGILESIPRFVPSQYDMVWPVHPRTVQTLRRGKIDTNNFNLVDPLGYLDFISLASGATAIITDSGGIQEEAAYLQVPCFTLRDSTERHIPIKSGFNVLADPLLLTQEDFEDRIEIANTLRKYGPINAEGVEAKAEMVWSSRWGASGRIVQELSEMYGLTE